MASYPLSEKKRTITSLAGGLGILAMVAATATVGCGGESGVNIGADAGQDGNPSQTAAPPQFDPPEGTYFTAQSVTLRTDTAGATIRYTLDGSMPDAASPIYASPITVARTTTLKAVARKDGWNDSPVQSKAYVIETPKGDVAQVQFSPGAGKYSNDVDVALSSGTDGATICYTLDGTAPACAVDAQCAPGSLTYTSPLSIPKTTDVVRAKACKSGMLPADPTLAQYVFSATAPAFDPPPEKYDPLNPVQVKLSTGTEGAEIHYTIDGSMPSCSSPNVVITSGTLPPFERDTHVQAVTCKDHYESSGVWDAHYGHSTCEGTFGIADQSDLQKIAHCKEITEHLSIGSGITDLTAIRHLQRVGQNLIVNAGPGLKSLHGLEALTSVGGDVKMTGTSGASLQLDGLDALRTVGGEFTILGTGVTEWSGPPRLAQVGSLRILGEAHLRRVGAFPALATIAKNVLVQTSPELTTFEAMTNVTTMGGEVSVRFNNKLTAVLGVPQQLHGLFIYSNPELTRVVGKSTTGIEGPLQLQDNPKLAEVELPYLGHVTGEVFLQNLPALASLQGFRRLAQVKNLVLWGDFGFTDFRGLEELRHVDEMLSIGTSSAVELTGLDHLISAGSVDISGNKKLKSLRGLGWFTRVSSDKGISISGNPELADLGDFLDVIEEAREIRISRNPKLTSLPGFTVLKKLHEKLEITDNDALPACHGEKLARKLRDLGYAGEVILRDNNGTGTCN
ncbi:chitobiase/beta-hexosaminidase C-terminal domain-containing protein [Pendulispora rubella]|uniref:Chitobiase/beta-hexosaminidase C-terminal domain-containing protein n=1 Tax=Pendulispora rubella TaxID=2741070 RepID=A0ABZ2KSA3_9BACT